MGQTQYVYQLDQDTAANYVLSEVAGADFLISDSTAVHIEPDDAGGFWVVNTAGELAHHSQSGVASHMVSAAPAGLDYINDVAETETDMWIVGIYPLLYQFSFETETWEEHTIPDYGYYRFVAREDGIWLISVYLDRPPLHFHDGQWEAVSLPLVNNLTKFVDISLGADSSLWVLTETYLYHESSDATGGWEIFGFTGSQLPRPPYRGLMVDQQGNVWVSNKQAKVLTRYDGQTFTSFTNPVPWVYESAPANMTCDSTGRVWLYYGREVRRFNDTGLEVVPQDDYIQSMVNLGEKMLYIRYDNIDTRDLDGQLLSSMPQFEAPLTKGRVGNVHLDRFDNQWMLILDYNGTVSLYNPEGVNFAVTVADTTADTTQTTGVLAEEAFYLKTWQQSGQLIIQTDFASPAGGTWELLNLQGQTLQTASLGAGKRMEAISVEGLSAGIYYLRVTTAQQQQVAKILLR